MDSLARHDKDGYSFVIENPKGSYKEFTSDPQDTYPLKGVTYPVDYGYIEGYRGEDGHSLDVFLGSGEGHGYIKVWRDDVPSETKFLYRVTEEEFKSVVEQFSPVIKSSAYFPTLDGFRLNIDKFKVRN